VAILGSLGFLRAFVPIGLALTTTALGTLLPILHDHHMLSGDFGRYVLAAGAVGELFPIVAISLFLTGRGEFVAIALTTTALGTLLPILRENHLLGGLLGSHLLAAGAVGELLPIIAVAVFLGTANRWVALISLAAVTVVAFGLTFLSRSFRIERIRTFIEEGEHETTQVTVRGTVLLLTLLLAVTEQFHLDAVLGAFLAGMVLRRWAGRGLPTLEGKLDALGYGFFIPIFFVYSGMTMDLRSMASAPLRVLLFTALMLLVHVVPAQLLYRKVLNRRERWQLSLITSTALPLLVAISEIGLRNGTMLPANAAALVGAGVLTVLVFPAVAVVLRRPPIVSDAPVP